MKLFIGADHNGFELKHRLTEYLQAQGHEVVDTGDDHYDKDDDFPQFAARAVSGMRSSGLADPKAILICGSGQGMCIAANRFKGIRACLVWNESEAKASRNDDDCNVLCLPAHQLSDFGQLTRIVDLWLKTPFMGAERFSRRIRQLDELAG